MDEGRIVRTRPLPRIETPPQFADFDGECFEHERIAFVSQPAEWAPGDAGCRGFAHARARARAAAARLAAEGRDAGQRPVPQLRAGVRRPAVDRRRARRAAASGSHATSSRRLSCCRSSLRSRRDCRSPGRCRIRSRASRTRRSPAFSARGAGLKPRPLAHASRCRPRSPRRRPRRGGTPRAMKAANEEQARYILGALARGLAAAGQPLRDPSSKREARTGIATRRRAATTAAPTFEAKRTFIADAIAGPRPRRTLDIGANTGEYSEIAASQGEVVALDIDERSVAAIWDARTAGQAAGSCRSSAISGDRRRRSAGATASSNRCLAARPAVSTWS